jgi:hypothetical protein
MQTAFDEWLAALRLANKGPIVLKAATRALAWTDTDFSLVGDWSGAAIEGGIAVTPGAAEIATFTVSALVYDSVADKTSWSLSLASGTGANSTGALPADEDGDGVTYLPFALRLTPSGGAKDLMVGGVFVLLEAA